MIKHHDMPVKLPWDSTAGNGQRDSTYTRQRSDDLYHSARWARLSRLHRDAHPLCENCRRRGFSRPGTCTDHILPMPICRDFFFEEANLQTLCDECNHLKGQRDKELIGRWASLSGDQKALETLKQLKHIFR